MGNTIKQQWNFFEAQRLIVKFNSACLLHGYAVGLTGGVLFNGYSNNDLDLILYSLKDRRANYDPAVRNIIQNIVAPTKLYISNRTQDEKLVFILMIEDGRRIDLFIPSFSMKKRKDSLLALELPQEIIMS